LKPSFFQGETPLARIIYRRNRIDPTKISGPYSLLAVMLLVAEILFAVWFYRAENSVERIIAGLIMAVFFVCLMLLIMKINRNPDKEKARRMVNNMTDIFQDYRSKINWMTCVFPFRAFKATYEASLIFFTGSFIPANFMLNSSNSKLNSD
jgi:hypothetical protein